MTSEATYYRLCSSCRQPLAFGVRYYVCSVSTCNRTKMTLTFCSLPCWQAHVPTLRHRDAWAEERRAPTRDAWLAQEQAEARAAQEKHPEARHRPATQSHEPARTASAPSVVRRAVTASDPNHTAKREPDVSNEAPNDVLIVVSKVKAYIRARSGMNTADAVAEALSDAVRQACDQAIEHAKSDGRKTVMARDVGGSAA